MRGWLFAVGLMAACDGADRDTGPIDTDASDTDRADSDPPDTDDTVLPLAVCEVRPLSVAPPEETGNFTAAASYDPAEHPIMGFQWALIAVPEGSAAEITSGGSTSRSLRPDLAGAYTAQLVVTTDDGRVSEPCDVTLRAVPAQALWVQVHWARPDDIDLVVTGPDGDIPAVINVDRGGEAVGIEPVDGTYTVRAVDRPGSEFIEAHDVAVEILVAGVPVWSGTKPIGGEDTSTDFAEIVWSGGSATINEL